MGIRSFYSLFFYRLFTAIIGVAAAPVIYANEIEPVDRIQQEVEIFVEQSVRQHPANQASNDIKIDVRSIDPRLRLPKCDKALTHEQMQSRNPGGNMTVKTQCEGSQPWAIYTSAKVQIMGPVIVAGYPLARGSVITENDIRVENRDTSGIDGGFVLKPEQAIGMEVKSSVRQGEPLRLSQLVEPLAVNKGDKVVIEAGRNGMSVTAPGKAMANGRTGDQIKVMNTNSERIIHAIVTGPGRVNVAL